MIRRLAILLLSGGIVCICLGCLDDKRSSVKVSKQFIEGEWDMIQVLRDDKVTKSLEGGFIVFEDDNTVRSNILMGKEKHTFTIDERVIKISGDPNLTYFEVSDVIGDTLTLRSKVSYFDMVFTLVKK